MVQSSLASTPSFKTSVFITQSSYTRYRAIYLTTNHVYLLSMVALKGHILYPACQKHLSKTNQTARAKSATATQNINERFDLLHIWRWHINSKQYSSEKSFYLHDYYHKTLLANTTSHAN